MRLPKLPKPISTGAFSLYPYNPEIEKKLKFVSRYDDNFFMSKTLTKDGVPKYTAVPRAICPIGDEDNRVTGEKFTFDINFKPRNKEQSRVVRESVELLRQGKSFIAEAPTGFGKTIVAAAMIGHIGVKTLIIVPKNDIVKQWKDSLKMILGLKDDEIGLIQGNTCEVTGKKVCITMVQSIAKKNRYPKWIYKEFGFLVVDETHVMGADFFSECMWKFPAKLRLGLSATPTRKDGKDIVFFSHIGPIRVVTKAMALKPKIIRKKSSWKCPVYRRNDPMSPTGYKFIQIPHKAGRTQNINKALARNDDRNAVIADFVRVAYNKGRSIIIFSDLKNHLDQIRRALIGVGIPTKDIAYYIGGLSETDRERAKTKPVILATYAMVSMATDIPWLDTCVLGTPRSDVIQTVGRILREWEDKKEPVVFDVVDEDSSVLKGYSHSRLAWYRKIGAKVVNVA